jgi:cell division protein ZipA
MFDFVFSLRFLLLLVGALFVAGIYLWGSAKIKRNARIKFDPMHARFDPPKRRTASQATSSLPHPPEGGSDDPEFVDGVVIADAAPVEELPVITRDGEDESAPLSTTRKEGQMELTFGLDAAPTADGVSAQAQETIIALYVRPPAGHEFAGTAILRAMNSVGLRFGDMDIFHHFGAGDLRTESPLFSVANIMEPGNFDLEDIERFSTPGLAMFLRLPGPLDGAVAFELFLNTAQRLSEALSGDLYGAPKKLLDGAMIDAMRHRAAPFANAG